MSIPLTLIHHNRTANVTISPKEPLRNALSTALSKWQLQSPLTSFQLRHNNLYLDPSQQARFSGVLSDSTLEVVELRSPNTSNHSNPPDPPPISPSCPVSPHATDDPLLYTSIFSPQSTLLFPPPLPSSFYHPNPNPNPKFPATLVKILVGQGSVQTLFQSSVCLGKVYNWVYSLFNKEFFNNGSNQELNNNLFNFPFNLNVCGSEIENTNVNMEKSLGNLLLSPCVVFDLKWKDDVMERSEMLDFERLFDPKFTIVNSCYFEKGLVNLKVENRIELIQMYYYLLEQLVEISQNVGSSSCQLTGDKGEKGINFGLKEILDLAKYWEDVTARSFIIEIMTNFVEQEIGITVDVVTRVTELFSQILIQHLKFQSKLYTHLLSDLFFIFQCLFNTDLFIESVLESSFFVDIINWLPKMKVNNQHDLDLFKLSFWAINKVVNHVTKIGNTDWAALAQNSTVNQSYFLTFLDFSRDLDQNDLEYHHFGLSFMTSFFRIPGLTMNFDLAALINLIDNNLSFLIDSIHDYYTILNDHLLLLTKIVTTLPKDLNFTSDLITKLISILQLNDDYMPIKKNCTNVLSKLAKFNSAYSNQLINQLINHGITVLIVPYLTTSIEENFLIELLYFIFNLSRNSTFISEFAQLSGIESLLRIFNNSGLLVQYFCLISLSELLYYNFDLIISHLINFKSVDLFNGIEIISKLWMDTFPKRKDNNQSLLIDLFDPLQTSSQLIYHLQSQKPSSLPKSLTTTQLRFKLFGILNLIHSKSNIYSLVSKRFHCSLYMVEFFPQFYYYELLKSSFSQYASILSTADYYKVLKKLIAFECANLFVIKRVDLIANSCETEIINEEMSFYRKFITSSQPFVHSVKASVLPSERTPKSGISKNG
ncbi:hypothetical protein P9112_009324 [Eukaryota sp. TZLM1-RC]